MINLQKLIKINRLIFLVNQKDHKNCRIQLLVVANQNKIEKKWWWRSTQTEYR